MFSSRITQDDESYISLFWTFLKIGSTAFGGFMALISVVQNYVVDRRALLSHEEMLNGISLATILPGPVAVNVVAYSGYKIRGLPGAFICAFAVILPSFLLLLVLSHAYFTWGELPAVSKVFNGFLPAVAAVIIAAALKMGQKELLGKIEILIAICSMSALIFIGGFYITLIIIFVSAVLGYFLLPHGKSDNYKDFFNKALLPKDLSIVAVVSLVSIGIALFESNTFILFKLFSTFSTMSLLLFGGGFVFIPLIQEVVVNSYGWLNDKEFIDGIALGQITPGPILISATFIGYKVSGVIGAIVATLGIFLPPAILMLISANFLDLIKNSAAINAILKGIRCAVIGIIAAAAYTVLLSADKSWISLSIFILALIALLKLKLEVIWVIPTAGLLGYFLF